MTDTEAMSDDEQAGYIGKVVVLAALVEPGGDPARSEIVACYPDRLAQLRTERPETEIRIFTDPCIFGPSADAQIRWMLGFVANHRDTPATSSGAVVLGATDGEGGWASWDVWNSFGRPQVPPVPEPTPTPDPEAAASAAAEVYRAEQARVAALIDYLAAGTAPLGATNDDLLQGLAAQTGLPVATVTADVAASRTELCDRLAERYGLKPETVDVVLWSMWEMSAAPRTVVQAWFLGRHRLDR